MTRDRWRVYLLVVGFGAIITLFAVVGMVFVFNAADESRDLGHQLKCQELVLGDYIHKFHVNMAAIESLESNDASRASIIKVIVHEPDLRAAMNKC